MSDEQQLEHVDHRKFDDPEMILQMLADLIGLRDTIVSLHITNHPEMFEGSGESSTFTFVRACRTEFEDSEDEA